MDKPKMKLYEGKKQILAGPMNRGEYNVYRGWELPSDEDGTEEGMLVEYVDGGKANHVNHEGYISWSPIDVFINAYTPNGSWQERLAIEEKELSSKVAKLRSALTSGVIPKEEVAVLTEQYRVMFNYNKILIERLEGTSTGLVDFGCAVDALKRGKLVQRKGWNGKGLFVMKQVPADIGLDIIPNMQSVQQDAKDILIERGTTLKYENQMLIIKEDGTADSWVPSSSDVFSTDWVILSTSESNA